jgi:RNA polymerase sigma-70 factor (ECF subfamily)
LEGGMADWSQIVAEHGPMVWKTAYRLLSNDADAADCFQRTFLAAVEFARQQTVRHWPALLRRLATSRALEQLRVRIRERGRQTSFDSEPIADRASRDPFEIAQTTELAERLRVALADIDPRQAQVFCLTQLERQSYDDVATELGLTVNHVGVLLNRARATLKERLAAFAPNRASKDKREV